MDILEWMTELRALFPLPEELEIAAEIYSFISAFQDGLTPQEAYDDFDQWVTA